MFARSKSGKTFVVAYKNGAARFRDSMDYPGRYDWGQEVGVLDYSSGRTLNVQGVNYVITYSRWAAGTEVTISPAPTDWGDAPGPTPPVSTTLFWREVSGSESLLVDTSGRVVVTQVNGETLVVLRNSENTLFWSAAGYDSYLNDWGSVQLLINQPISIVEVDGVNYTFTSEEVTEYDIVSISPNPGTYQ